MSESQHYDFAKPGEAWKIEIPEYEDNDVHIKGVTITVTRNAHQLLEMSVHVDMWAPYGVLSSGEDDHRPRLKIRYNSTTTSSDGSLVTAIEYPNDKFNVPDKSSGPLNIGSGTPQWAALAIQASH